jgi:hypothetical protein
MRSSSSSDTGALKQARAQISAQVVAWVTVQ